MGIGLLIAENVAEDVEPGRLGWTPLSNAGAESFSCLLFAIRPDHDEAMCMFLKSLRHSIARMEERFKSQGIFVKPQQLSL
jgi:hypothetical protein